MPFLVHDLDRVVLLRAHPHQSHLREMSILIRNAIAILHIVLTDPKREREQATEKE